MSRKWRDIETNLSNLCFEDFISLTFNKTAIFKIFSIKALFKSQMQFIKMMPQLMVKQYKDVISICRKIWLKVRQIVTIA